MDDFRKNPGGFPPLSFPEEGWRGRNRKNGMALPFYMTYPIPMFWEEEDTASRDLDYLVQLYPEQAKKYRQRISRMLDGMDYQGSMIYDEYPDRLALLRLAESVQARIRQEEEEEQGREASVEDSRDRKTLIQILLYYEIFRRRRRNGRSCQGWTRG